MANELKVGDRVRLINTDSVLHNQTGTIENMTEYNEPVVLFDTNNSFDDENKPVWCMPSEIVKE